MLLEVELILIKVTEIVSQSDAVRGHIILNDESSTDTIVGIINVTESQSILDVSKYFGLAVTSHPLVLRAQ